MSSKGKLPVTYVKDEQPQQQLTMWQKPFDLAKLPPTITAELTKRTPLLLGSDQACYSKCFFKSIGGLCGSGIPLENLAKEDHGVPLEELVATYPLNRHGNRHSMKLMSDRHAVNEALDMYQRVYGGTQPDNGEFGTAFIRGLVLTLQRSTKVDWAKHASDFAKKRLENPPLNPQKLTPPCLREQIQEIIYVFRHYLRMAYADRDASVAQMRQHNLPVKPSDFPTRQPRLVEIVTPMRQPQSEEWVSPVKQPHLEETLTPVRQPRSAGRVQNARRTQSPICLPPSTEQADPVAKLKQKRAKMESKWESGMKNLRDAEHQLKVLHSYKHELELSEEANWESMVTLRFSKKRSGLQPAELGTIEEELRLKTAAASSISKEAADLDVQMVDLRTRIAVYKKATQEVQDALGTISTEIDETILKNSKICPKQILSDLPVTAVGLRKLEAGLPCVLCGRFWVENAIVCLPCGCLLHPVCMSKVALSANPRCPFCSHVPGELWRAQWGYPPTTDERLSAAIAAYNAGMDAAGSMKPLDAVGARARMEDVLLGMGSQESVAKPKRALTMGRVDEDQPLPKRAHLEIAPAASVVNDMPTILEEVNAIGNAAADEASAAMLQETCSLQIEISEEGSAARSQDNTAAAGPGVHSM